MNPMDFQFHLSAVSFWKYGALVILASSGFLAMGESYVPSGCSTLITCNQIKDKNDLKQGEEICFNAYKKEMELMRSNWKNGELEGSFSCSKDDGTPYVRAHYRKGKLDGSYEEYDKSLNIWSLKQGYKDGKREGVSQRELSGKRKIIRYYKNDNAYGWELLLDENSKILEKRSCETENTRRDDKVCDEISVPGFEAQLKKMTGDESVRKQNENNREIISKYRSGQVKEKYTLVDGQRHGKNEVFFESGLPKLIEDYDHGKKRSQKVFFDEGQIKSETKYDCRTSSCHIESEIQYYQNGKMKSKTKHSASEKWAYNIEYTEFFDNGKESEIGRRYVQALDSYGGGVYDGEIKKFSNKGEPRSLEYYDKGTEIGDWKRWDDDYAYEYHYEKGILKQKIVLDKKTKKQMRKTELMKDGSVKSDVIDPAYALSIGETK